MITTWGYTLTGTEALADLLTVADFNTYTANKYATDSARIEAEIGAASGAIRNYVGWHLYPSAACEFSAVYHDQRISRNGRDLVIQLPARFVSAVSSVTVDETVYDAFSFSTDGLIHVYDVAPCDRYAEIVVEYTAGLSDANMDAVKELVMHRVTHSVAIPSGITSEASGGVSITYNANWVNSARATALPDDNKEVLAPYRLQGVF